MSGLRVSVLAAVAALGILAVPAMAAATPVPVSITGVNSLDSIACPTGTTCVAVGVDGNLANGKSVTVDTATGKTHVWSGSLTNDPLNAVACPDATTCLTVADDAVATVQVSTGAMKVTATPPPPANGIVALNSIACASATECYAAGFEGSPGNSVATLVKLSAAGKLQATKKDSAGTGIGSLACPTSTLCLLAEHLTSGEVIRLLNNGAFGSTQAVPANTYIQAVRCFQATACYALGGSTSGSSTNELFPVNPATGAVGAVKTITGFSGTGMTCDSASTCLIVGFVGSGATAKPAVVTVTNGVPGSPATLPGVGLDDVACASPSLCYAVGLNKTGALVEKA